MVKNTMLKKDKERMEDFFDFCEDMESMSEEAMAGMMSGLLEASNNQLMMAIELTKLVVEKSAAESMKEEDVFSAFKRASNVIAENFPLKALLEKFN